MANSRPSRRSFSNRVLGWQVEQMEMVDYRRITTGTGESSTLNGGLTYRALLDLNGWMLYVQVPALDETVEIVKSLGGSVVRPKTAVLRAAWVTIVRDPAKNIFGVWQADPTAFPLPEPNWFTRSERRKERMYYADNLLQS